MIFTVRMVTLWRPSASSPLYWMQTQVWGSESQFLSGLSVSYFNDKTTCSLGCYRLTEWKYILKSFKRFVCKKVFPDFSRFSTCRQGSAPESRWILSCPCRGEQNPRPAPRIWETPLGRVGQTGCRVRLWNIYQIFGKYPQLELGVFWCQLHRPSVQDAGREVSAEETIESVENLPRVAGHLEHFDV